MSKILTGIILGAAAVAIWYNTAGRKAITLTTRETVTVTNTIAELTVITNCETVWATNIVYKTVEVEKEAGPKQITQNAAPKVQPPVQQVAAPVAAPKPNPAAPSSFNGPRPAARVDNAPIRTRLHKKMDGTVETVYY